MTVNAFSASRTETVDVAFAIRTDRALRRSLKKTTPYKRYPTSFLTSSKIYKPLLVIILEECNVIFFVRSFEKKFLLCCHYFIYNPRMLHMYTLCGYSLLNSVILKF